MYFGEGEFMQSLSLQKVSASHEGSVTMKEFNSCLNMRYKNWTYSNESSENIYLKT